MTSGGDEIKTWDAEKLLQFARLSETAERYEDMSTYMRQLCEKKSAESKLLTMDERNLLSVAFKNVVGAKRSCWRSLDNAAQSERPKDEAALVESYKAIVEKELEEVCNGVLKLIKKLVSLLELAMVESGEAMRGKKTLDQIHEDRVFYLKMGGDYSRYLAEFKPDDKEIKNDTEQHYEKAMGIARDKLAETHPTRLGLALNFSVCYYEILKKRDAACKLAKEAFDAAIEKLDTLGDATYKDSTLIMQLLRDNLTLWTSNQEDAEQGDEAPAGQ